MAGYQIDRRQVFRIAVGPNAWVLPVAGRILASWLKALVIQWVAGIGLSLILVKLRDPLSRYVFSSRIVRMGGEP